jgi:phytoene dehydrogenase-like protein
MTGANVAIIGGGLAGLTAAALAAREGAKVTLFERSEELGGRARTITEEGFHLNMGAHALYRGGPAMEILQRIGVRFTGSVPAAAGEFVTGGRAHKLPSGLASMVTSRALGVRGKFEVASLIAGLPRIDPRQFDHVPLEEWVGKRAHTSEARELLLALLRLATYTNNPRVMSAGAAIQQLQLALKSSVLYLDGGWQTLVDGLSNAATEAGAMISAGSPVASVQRIGSSWQLMRSDGERFEAASVILAVSPRQAADLTGDPTLSGVAEAAVPARAAVMDVCLSQLPNPRTAFALGGHPPLYLQVHSVYASLAPKGGALVSLLKYLPAGEAPDPQRDERDLEALMDLVQPGWRSVCLHSRFLPSMTAVEDIPRASRGGLTGRPSTAVPNAPGLFVVGDWVGPEGLLADAVIASAAKAAAQAVSFARSSPRTEAAVR